jgi:uncharacterized protein (DUF2336 family)
LIYVYIDHNNGQAETMLDKSKSDKARTKVPWAVVINTSLEKPEPDTTTEELPVTEAAEVAPEPVAEPTTPSVEAAEPQCDLPAESADRGPEPSPASLDARCDDAVVRSLMDVLITPAGMVQPQERAFAADLLLQVMEYATPEAKHMLCDRLSNMPDAPASLISRFINDPDLKLSAVLLENASCVSDSELITVVEKAEHDRSMLVAKRQHLSAAVGTALAKTGDAKLALALVKNPCVQLSQEALQRLADLAFEHEELVEPLVMRSDMSAACALYLFWSMPAKQRAYALGRFLAEVQVLPQILVMSKPGADLVATALRSSGEQGKGRDGAAGQTEKPSKQKAAQLIEALETGACDAVARLICEHAAVEQETALRIVTDIGGEPLTVACKALGASRFAFGDAFVKWQSSQGRETDAEALRVLFDTLSFKQARMALTYWDWQTQRVGPYRDAFTLNTS